MRTGYPSALGDAPELTGILAVPKRIGGRIVAGAVLPAMTVQRRAVVYDPAEERATIPRSYAAAVIALPVQQYWRMMAHAGDSVTCVPAVRTWS